MITLKIKIGKDVLEIQQNDIKTIHEISAVYGALPKRCDACNSENIYLSYKNPKGNDYYTIKCKDCTAELALHQKKEGKGFYLVDGEKMVEYKPIVKDVKETFDGENVNQNQDSDVPW